ncbi:MAG: CsbD family protein [Lysinibacillus sp.]
MANLSDKMKGVGNKLKGEAKENLGKVTNDPELRAEGKMDRLKGEAQEEVAEMKGNLLHDDDELQRRKD